MSETTMCPHSKSKLFAQHRIDREEGKSKWNEIRIPDAQDHLPCKKKKKKVDVTSAEVRAIALHQV